MNTRYLDYFQTKLGDHYRRTSIAFLTFGVILITASVVDWTLNIAAPWYIYLGFYLIMALTYIRSRILQKRMNRVISELVDRKYAPPR